MEYYIHLTILSCLLLAYQDFIVGEPDLAIKDGSYNEIRTNTRLLGEKTIFDCSFNQLDETKLYRITLQTGSVDKDNWKAEGSCLYEPGARRVTVDNAKTLRFTEDNVTCDSDRTFMQIATSQSLSTRVNYRCHLENLYDAINQFSSIVTLNTHTQPDSPIIQPEPIEIDEGNSAQITCHSNAHPAPQLSIRLDSQTKISSPAVDENLSEPLLQNTTLTWTIPSASANMDGSTVECRVINHPYGVVKATKTMHVIYGPSKNQGLQEVEHNINSKDPLTIEVSMEAYPALDFKWFSGTDEIAQGASYTVESKYFTAIKVFPETVTFKVRGTNPRTKNWAEKTVNVIVQDKSQGSGAPPSGANEQTTPSGGLEGWHIGLIVLAVIVVLVAVIGASVLLVKKKRSSSSAKRTKAAQARRPSDERNDGKYQSSTTSLARQDTAGRTANYHENPTLPVEYRYSQGNVEEYAEVIDDRPRSRKPIALEDMDAFDANNGPPMFEEAPPAYTDMGHPDMGRPDMGYPDMGHPDMGHPDMGRHDMGHPDMGHPQYRMEPSYSNYSPNYGDSFGAKC